MRFVIPLMGLVMIALLVADFYPPLRVGTQESDLSNFSRPDPLPVLTPSPTPDMTSLPALTAAAETHATAETQEAVEAPATSEVSATIEPAAQAAPEVPAKIESEAQVATEVPAKIEPTARAARAQAPPMKKKGVISSEELFRQKPPWLLDDESFFRYIFLGR
jgi:hypothetical protein